MNPDTANSASDSAARSDKTVYQNEDPAYRVFVDTLSYLDPDEIALIVEAYRFSEQAHQGQ